jgi:sialate O-acetylesterase
MKEGVLFFVFLIVTQLSLADVKLPRLISNGMVLQRETELTLWGWADEGEDVIISFRDKVYSSVAMSNGQWQVKIPAQTPGGPFQMVIEGKNKIEIDNIMVGDVWLCSGQSNMELPVRRVSQLYNDEIKNANNREIRQFMVPKHYNFRQPENNIDGGQWIECNPSSVLDFSAVAWFFAVSLHEKYQIPIGLINASLGGSPAEAWMSFDALSPFPHLQNEAMRLRNDSLIAKIKNDDRLRIDSWYRLSTEKDAGNAKNSPSWKLPEIRTDNWDTISMPAYWPLKNGKPINGVVWMKRTIDLESVDTSKPASLSLGAIVDADSVFVNGTLVGTTSYQYPPRHYNVPAGVLVEGTNTITVRVISNMGRGGFVPGKQYELHTHNQSIPLTGIWRYRIGSEMEPLQGETFIQWKPNGLFNGMIAPLSTYRIKGVVWYQGESNTGNPAEYAKLFPSLITDWRNLFKNNNLPFLFVQLSSFMKSIPYPAESNWAKTREAQSMGLKLANTGMAVTIDVGEWNDIHPLNKKTVGQRLALAAQRVAYNDKSVVYSGPVLMSFKIKGNKIELKFKSIADGLKTSDGKDIKTMAVAGNDKKFEWAKAKIKGSKILVWSDSVSTPLAVRYGWADNPEGANLINSVGLPASPFRTDNW